MPTFFSYKGDAEVLKESILWFFVQIYEIMLQYIIFYYIHIVIYIYLYVYIYIFIVNYHSYDSVGEQFFVNYRICIMLFVCSV